MNQLSIFFLFSFLISCGNNFKSATIKSKVSNNETEDGGVVTAPRKKQTVAVKEEPRIVSSLEKKVQEDISEYGLDFYVPELRLDAQELDQKTLRNFDEWDESLLNIVNIKDWGYGEAEALSKLFESVESSVLKLRYIQGTTLEKDIFLKSSKLLLKVLNWKIMTQHDPQVISRLKSFKNSTFSKLNQKEKLKIKEMTFEFEKYKAFSSSVDLQEVYNLRMGLTQTREKIIHNKALAKFEALSFKDYELIGLTNPTALKLKSGRGYSLKVSNSHLYPRLLSSLETSSVREKTFRFYEETSLDWNFLEYKKNFQQKLLLAQELGYESWADFLGKDEAELLDFDREMIDNSKKSFKKSLKALKEIKKSREGNKDLFIWDLDFYLSRYAHDNLNINMDEVDSHFSSLENVISFLEKAFSMRIEKLEGIDYGFDTRQLGLLAHDIKSGLPLGVVVFNYSNNRIENCNPFSVGKEGSLPLVLLDCAFSVNSFSDVERLVLSLGRSLYSFRKLPSLKINNMTKEIKNENELNSTLKIFIRDFKVLGELSVGSGKEFTVSFAQNFMRFFGVSERLKKRIEFSEREICHKFHSFDRMKKIKEVKIYEEARKIRGKYFSKFDGSLNCL